jgi:hypothetical protein
MFIHVKCFENRHYTYICVGVGVDLFFTHTLKKDIPNPKFWNILVAHPVTFPDVQALREMQII